ncbi:MAG: hemolysin family protein [Paludibacter sp.]|nr:hemolysin family protein [Paludibacter sp.]MDD4198294.1 hemolysin family protein [Paludibacter sp.]MDD4426942.1 hemolysin family protein [Paludibacter sp.]
MDTLTYIIITLILSAFFSGMEIAFVSSNKLRFELEKKERSLTSSLLSIFYKHPQQFISSMLVGNNIALVVYGLMMADFLSPLFSFTQNQFLITFLQTILATIIVLFTGEFLPKTIFRTNPNLWLRVFAWLVFLFYIVLYPIAYFTTWLSKMILRIFKTGTPEHSNNTMFSRIDLSYLIQESFDKSNLEEEIETEVKFFQNALDFSNVKLRDCSVPRTEIIALEYEASLETLKQTFIETGFSKIPIYKENIDNIIGYIHASEMFEHPNDWKKYIRQIPIVPENMTAHKLMKLFMQHKKSIAVVVDEHGGTNGIITLEDIIEEILGEIEDEHDNREYIAKQLNEKEYLLSGRMEVQQANEKFGLNIPESDEYETIAGFVLHHHQHFPKLNEVIRIGDFNLKCIKVTNNRIELIRLFLGG